MDRRKPRAKAASPSQPPISTRRLGETSPTSAGAKRDDPWRALFDGAALPAAVVSSAGLVLHTTASLRELLGYSVQELRAARWADLTHPSVR